MSYTNQTQHYNLPQYVGTDVPAWLTDINGAFATIDTGMNAAKTQADSASAAAGQAANDIAALTTTVNAQAAQISAAAQAASNAQTTANTADGKADALDTRVATLENTAGFAAISLSSSDKLGDITTAGGSFTATEDCYCVGTIGNGSSSADASILIDGNQLFGYYLGPANSNLRCPVCFPVKSGQTVGTTAVSGLYYRLNFYKLKRDN